MASLYASLRSGSSNQVDFLQLGESLLEEWRVGLNRVLSLRRSEQTFDSNSLDLNYRDIVERPLESVEEILSFLGLSPDNEFRLQMSQYLANNQKGKHGQHSYDLGFFGLTDQDIDLAFADYIETYRLND